MLVIDILYQPYEMPHARDVVGNEQIGAVPGIALAEVVCLILGAHLVGARPCMLEHPAHVVHAARMDDFAASFRKRFQIMRDNLGFHALARAIHVQKHRVGIRIVVEAHLVRHLAEQAIALILPRAFTLIAQLRRHVADHCVQNQLAVRLARYATLDPHVNRLSVIAHRTKTYVQFVPIRDEFLVDATLIEPLHLFAQLKRRIPIGIIGRTRKPVAEHGAQSVVGIAQPHLAIALREHAHAHRQLAHGVQHAHHDPAILVRHVFRHVLAAAQHGRLRHSQQNALVPAAPIFERHSVGAGDRAGAVVCKAFVYRGT